MEAFYKIHPKVNLNEIYLLSWFIDFYHTGKLEFFTYKQNPDAEYYWFSYPYFLKENPFFNIKSSRGVYNVIKSLEKKGFIVTDHDKMWMQINRKLLFRFTEPTLEIVEIMKPKDFSGSNDE